MSKLLKTVREELMGGISPNIPGRSQTPTTSLLNSAKPKFFVDGRNVVFEESSVQPTSGQRLIVSPVNQDSITGLLSVNAAGTPTAYYGNSTTLFEYTTAGGATSVGSGYAGVENATSTTPATLWSLTSWGTWIAATNGVDVPQIFKGTSFANLTGLSFTTAEIFIERSPFMIAFNTSNGVAEAEWCDEDNIEDWSPTTSNAAGNLTIREAGGPILAAVMRGKDVAFYTNNRMFILEFVGAPFWFRYRPLLMGIGTVGKAAVVAVGAIHYGFGPEGIWATDGTKFEYIASPEIRDFIYNNINLEQISKVVAWHDRQQHSVIFFWPEDPSTANSLGVVFNYKNKIWSIDDRGRSAATYAPDFGVSLAGDSSGYLWQQNITGDPTTNTNSGELPVQDEISYQVGFGEGGFGEVPFGGDWTGEDTLDG